MDELNTRLAQCYKKDDQLVSREIAGELILVPIRAHANELDSIFTLNETGAWIWEQLDGEKSLAEICSGLVSEFEVNTETAEQDLLEIIQNLEAIQAVVKV